MAEMPGSVAPAPLDKSGSEALRRAQALREEEKLADAAEVLAAAVEEAVAELGADVHPSLGDLWLEYGDVLLELEEEEDLELEEQTAEAEAPGDAVASEAGVAASDADAKGDADAPSVEAPAAEGADEAQGEDEAQGADEAQAAEGADDEEAEDDLQLAWECLETARRCFEAQEGGGSRQALSKVHIRLADLLMMQNRAEEAVEEYRTSLVLRLSDPGLAEPRAESAPADASALSVVARDGFVRLCMALVRAGRATSFHTAAAEAQQLLSGLGDDLVRHLGPASSAAHEPSVEEPASGGIDGPVAEVAVRRKRPREEEPVLAAGASKART